MGTTALRGPAMIRIVLGEDHSLVREGTRHMLQQHVDLTVVGEAGEGDAISDLIASLKPDVAILDIRMPGLTGIEIVRRAKEASPSTKCVILTAYDDDDFVLAAMEAGAAGYLLKTVRAGELADAVRAVHRGETVLHPEIGRKIAVIWARRQAGTADEFHEALTQREMKILELAAQGMRNKEIAQTLGISTRTVEGHFSIILAKLDVPSRTAAVIYGATHHWFSLTVRNEDR